MKKITELLEKGVEDGVFPGASFAYGTPGDFESGAVGRHTYSEDSPEITASTLFDMASVTKVVSTTSTALVLNQHDQIELDTAASAGRPSGLESVHCGGSSLALSRCGGRVCDCERRISRPAELPGRGSGPRLWRRSPF